MFLERAVNSFGLVQNMRSQAFAVAQDVRLARYIDICIVRLLLSDGDARSTFETRPLFSTTGCVDHPARAFGGSRGVARIVEYQRTGIMAGMPNLTHALALLRLWRSKVRKILRPVLVALLNMWPVTVTAVLLVACFLLPGLASDQAVEAMLGYVWHSDSVQVLWTKFGVTVLSAVALSNIMRGLSHRLITRPRVPLIYRSWIGGIVGSLPLILLAVILTRLRNELAPAGGAFVAIAALLVSIYTIAVLRAALSSQKSAYASGAPIRYQKFKALLACLLPVLLLSAFAFSSRDRTFGLPVSLISISQALGPVNFLLLACRFWAITTSWLVLFARRTKVPIIGLLVALGACLTALNVNNDHEIRRSDHFTPSIELIAHSVCGLLPGPTAPTSMFIR